MIHKTHGVVFRFTRYGETSIVVTIFTEQLGLQTYMVNGVRTKSSRTRMALYQPLTLLDLVVYHKENASMMRIREIKCLHPCPGIAGDIRKETISMFLLEVLNRTVKEESHSEELYQFIEHAILTLEEQQSGVENFHLVFLVKLSRYLGFGLRQSTDLLLGRYITPEEEALAAILLESNYDTPLQFSTAHRRVLLEALERFYALHVENFGELKSVAVLREILS